MKAILAVLFLALVAVYAMEEMEYHPQAVLHYLEWEDREMAKKVRSIVKLEDAQPRLGPTGFPTGIPPKFKVCIVKAVKCHKNAGDDACKHLKCIKRTGKCLHKAGLRIKHLPPAMKKCLPFIPCCLLGSETCEEKLCCFVRFGECAKTLGDKEDKK